MQQVIVLLDEAGERVALQAVALDVADAVLDLALVARHARLAGQRHNAIVLAERLDLGVDLGIEPVGMADCGAKVVEDERAGHAAEVPEGVLQAADEFLRAFAPHHFAVGLA